MLNKVVQIKREVIGFENELKAKGYSKSTVTNSPKYISSFLDYTDKEVVDINGEDIKIYHEYLQTRPNKRQMGGLSNRYIYHQIYALKLFFSWKTNSQAISYNPMGELEFEYPNDPERETLTKMEIEELVNATENYKEKVCLILFYGCGLRREEAVKLNLKDIDHANKQLHVREGKGKKSRTVPLSDRFYSLMKQYIESERSGINIALMLNSKGNRMSGNAFNRVLKKILSRTNITKKISLHSLRHSIGTHLLQNGSSLEDVRIFLGHNSIESTSRYVRVDQQQILKINSQ